MLSIIYIEDTNKYQQTVSCITFLTIFFCFYKKIGVLPVVITIYSKSLFLLIQNIEILKNHFSTKIIWIVLLFFKWLSIYFGWNNFLLKSSISKNSNLEERWYILLCSIYFAENMWFPYQNKLVSFDNERLIFCKRISPWFIDFFSLFDISLNESTIL